MNHVLLLGAGFSRNWGGWLASEAFEYLLGCPQVDDTLKPHLWKHKDRGGFEAALAELQEEHFRSGRAQPEARLANLLAAIRQMFSDMDTAFGRMCFEFQQAEEQYLRTFLVRFDAIFTLNQDLLLERHYLDNNVSLSSAGRWDGWQLPGMKPAAPASLGMDNPNLGIWEPDLANFTVSLRLQPCFKLHGSSNWVAGADGLLVLGGNKRSIIERYPVLKWSHDQFKAYLAKPDTRLMVIGYSFGDDHINDMLRDAARNHAIGLFVVDPLGVDVMDKNRGAQIHAPSELAKALWPRIIGSSRRSLREIFGSDRAEHAKVMRFFRHS